jgi:gluconate kinase
MNPDLLKSQFDALEIPQDAVSIDVGQPLPRIVAAIRATLAI